MDVLKGALGGGGSSGEAKPDAKQAGTAADAVFKKYDKDNSGALDKAEVKKALAEVMGKLGLKEPSDTMVKMVLKVGDKDHDGKIDVKEFTSLVEKLLKVCEPKADAQATA